MKKYLLLFIIAAMWQTAYSQFETVWYKQLQSGITTVSFSHDSKWIMAWLSPNIMIFDVVTGTLVNDKIPATANYPFFSNDDSHIYGISGNYILYSRGDEYIDGYINNRIVFYNLNTGINESLADNFEKNKIITAFVVSKDQKYILCATRDSSNKGYSNDVGFEIWNLQTGKLIGHKKLYTEYNRISIDSTDFLANLGQIGIDCNNSRIFITEDVFLRKLLYVDAKGNAHWDNKEQIKMNIYDFNTFDSIGTNPNVTAAFWLSNNCQEIALGKYDSTGSLIQVFDINSNQLISTMKLGNIIGYLGVKFTPDDKYLVIATAEGGGISLWDVNSGKLINQKYPSGYQSLDISNDMNYIGTSSANYLGILKFPDLTGVKVLPDFNEIIYPNPTNGEISLYFAIPQGSVLSATLTDINGLNLGQLFNGILPAGANSLKINMHQYPSGTYFISLNAKQFNKIFKIILNK